MELMQRRRQLLTLQKSTRLPKEYQEVEWIQSTGTQAIDTGVLFNHGIKIKATMAWAEDLSLKALFGSRTMPGNYRYFLITLNGGADFAYINDRTGKFLIKDFVNELCEFTWDTTETNLFRYGVNGVFYTENASDFNTNVTGYIFAYHLGSNDSASAHSKAIYKSMVIEDASGIELFNGVPCYRKSDGEIGIYDLVSERFLTNIGTGTFIIPE